MIRKPPPRARRRILRGIGAAILGLWLGVGSLHGQLVIPDSAACHGCSVSVVAEARIGETEGPGSLWGVPGEVVLDGGGRIWVIHTNEPPQIFDGRGVHLMSLRSGEGPGEVRGSTTATAVGDSVVVVDRFLGRATVYGPDLAPMRTIRLPSLAIDDLAPIQWPARVLASGASGHPDMVGLPLHLLDLSGEQTVTVRSFGGEDGGLFLPTPEFQMRLSRALTTGPEGQAWAVQRYDDYRLVRWATDGRALGTIRRTTSWFPAGADGGPGGPNVAPRPSVQDVRYRGTDGSVWVLGRVPATAWHAAWADHREEFDAAIQSRGGGTGLFSVPGSAFPSVADLYGSLVEIIDPDRGLVLARQYVDGFPVSFLADGRVVIYEEDPNTKIPFLQVLRVTISEREGADAIRPDRTGR